MTRDDKRHRQPRLTDGEREKARRAKRRKQRQDDHRMTIAADPEKLAEERHDREKWSRGIAGRSQRPVSGEKTRGNDMKKAKRKALKANNARRSAQMRGKVSLPQWDHGAMGQANRIGMVVEERADVDPETGKRVNPNGVTGVRRVDLLEFWRNRNSITEGGYQAAVRLRDAYEATMCSKPSLPDNDRVQSSPKPDHAISIQIDRISRFDAMMRHVRQADRQIISACVLDGKHPSTLPQFNGDRHREGFAHLRAALDYISDRI